MPKFVSSSLNQRAYDVLWNRNSELSASYVHKYAIGISHALQRLLNIDDFVKKKKKKEDISYKLWKRVSNPFVAMKDIKN